MALEGQATLEWVDADGVVQATTVLGKTASTEYERIVASVAVPAGATDGWRPRLVTEKVGADSGLACSDNAQLNPGSLPCAFTPPETSACANLMPTGAGQEHASPDGSTQLEYKTFDPIDLGRAGLVEGDKVSLRWDAKTSNGLVAATLSVDWLDDTGAQVDPGGFLLPEADTEYRQHTATLTVPASATQMRVHALREQNGGSGVAFIKRIQVNRGKKACEFQQPKAERGIAWAVVAKVEVDDCTAGDLIQSFAAQGSLPTGVTFGDGSVWQADANLDEIHEINPADGSVIQTLAAPENPRGLAHDGTDLWMVGDGTDTIYQLSTADGTTISSFAAPTAGPTGIAHDGANLWIANTGNTIDEVQTDGTPVGSIAAPGSNPTGLTFDGTNLWVSDNTDDTIYKIDTAGTQLDSFPSPSTNPQGLGWDGADLWHADADADTIYELHDEPLGVTIKVAWDAADLSDTIYETKVIYYVDGVKVGQNTGVNLSAGEDSLNLPGKGSDAADAAVHDVHAVVGFGRDETFDVFGETITKFAFEVSVETDVEQATWGTC